MLEKLTQTLTKEMNQIVKDLKGTFMNVICCVKFNYCYSIFTLLATNKTATHDHKSRRLTDTEHRMIRTVHSSLTAKYVLFTFSVIRITVSHKYYYSYQIPDSVGGFVQRSQRLREPLPPKNPASNGNRYKTVTCQITDKNWALV